MDENRTVLPVGVNSADALRTMALSYLLRYPPNTRRIYQSHINQWVAWCRDHGVEPLLIQRAHIEAWGRYLGEVRKLKPSSVKAKLNCICGMYKFAHLDGMLLTNPAAYVRRPKVDFVSTTNSLSRSELADILKHAEAESWSTYTMICLLGLNGLRIGELLAIDVEHLGYERGFRTLHLPHRKGGRVSTLSLAVRTAYAVEQTLAGRQTGPLLLGRNGQRLDIAAARRTLRRLCRKAGITKRISPHGLRHSFVTLALDAGVPERDVMASTGHLHPQMITYYDRHRGSIERNATHAVAAFVGVAA